MDSTGRRRAGDPTARVRDGQEVDESPSFQSWDVGLSLGGGLTYAAKRAWPFVEAKIGRAHV